MEDELKNSEISLSTELSTISKDIIESKDADTIRKAAKLFQIATAKKELLRILKLSEISDQVEDLISVRLQTASSALKMSELVELSKALQMSIDRSNKMIGLVTDASEEAAKTVINISMGDKASMKSRERVKDTVLEIMQMLEKEQSKEIELSEDDVQEVYEDDDTDNNIEGQTSILDIDEE